MLMWFNHLVLVAAVVMLGMAISQRTQAPAYVALALFIGFVPLAIIQWVNAQSAKCPLCITPVLANKNCSRNRNAKTLLGSYRLHTSLYIIFSNHFRCPYCNEPTAMEVRKRSYK